MSSDAELALVSAAIAAIEQIIETVRNAKSGKVDPQVALDAITTLHSQLQSNNAKADSDLDSKFST